MAAKSEIALLGHLLRRAGFGASYDQLEKYAAKGYEATVEELIHPESQPPYEDDLVFRYIPYFRSGTGVVGYQYYWLFRMISSQRPLEEKITLFWHHLFATGFSKVDNAPQMNRQIEMFRKHGLGNLRTLLLELSKDPAMIFWLDNNENKKGRPNENYGRELLELFSLGVGKDGQPNYSEDDVKECARAFTGWTVDFTLPRYPYGEHFWTFEYHPEEHDDTDKVFLGQRGRFNGEDIVDIIVRQPATARFLARRLYDFFVADEPPVPAWQNTPPRDPAAVKLLEDEYFRTGGDIRAMLRVLFNSDFFKAEAARFAKVKSPAELIAGVMRLVDDYTTPKPRIHTIAAACGYAGQELLNPPTVEGWHTGQEWIDSGALVERVNFAAEQVEDIGKPGVRRMVDRLMAEAPGYPPEALLERCLELAGQVPLPANRRAELLAYLRKGGDLRCGSAAERREFAGRAVDLLRLIVSAPEYQFA